MGYQWWKICIITLGTGLLSEFVYMGYKMLKKHWNKNRQQIQIESKAAIEEVLFFPDQQIACKDFFVGEDGCTNLRCRYTHEHNSLSRLYEYLSAARLTLDVAVFVICCTDLCDLLILASKRNVKVRVICDNEQINTTGSQFWKLKRDGIDVRTDNSSYLMHHKFVIIDGHILLNGSFNWTRQAISGNQENLMILNNEKIVSQYKAEFEKLWADFDPRNWSSSELYRHDNIPQ